MYLAHCNESYCEGKNLFKQNHYFLSSTSFTTDSYYLQLSWLSYNTNICIKRGHDCNYLLYFCFYHFLVLLPSANHSGKLYALFIPGGFTGKCIPKMGEVNGGVHHRISSHYINKLEIHLTSPFSVFPTLESFLI